MDINWETKSPALHSVLTKGWSDAIFLNGGNLYDSHAYSVLSKRFHLAAPASAVKSGSSSIFQYLIKNTFSPKGNPDLIISGPYPLVFNLLPDYTRRVVVLHHFDYTLKKKDVFHQFYFSLLMRRLKKVAVVVTVSRYWKDYLIQCGLNGEKIFIIYNSFNPADYRFDSAAKNNFRKKYQLSDERPLIYIGSANPIKGVCEVFNQLKGCDYQLIMSGAENKAPDVDALFLRLSDTEFRVMLSTCDLVVSLSQLPEGWNRIAHEALLAGTPVIGSGIGGMRELLSGAKQLICDQPDKLQNCVKEVLGNKDQFSRDGYEFVKQFDFHYFADAWINLVENMKGR